eukprot:GHVT01033194.1.p1 GENE.GHVT01033194.1~~GHVT01033194.1.p1  ORF type:complete len:744 (-),score=2.28 GHVT01033194.1:660-2891(-)
MCCSLRCLSAMKVLDSFFAWRVALLLLSSVAPWIGHAMGEMPYHTYTDLPDVSDNRSFMGVIRPLYGANGQVGPFAPHLPTSRGFRDVSDQLSELGVNSIRLHDAYGPGDMMCIFPIDESEKELPNPKNPDNYNWDLTDREYRKIVEAGFAPMTTIAQHWRNFNEISPYGESIKSSYPLGYPNSKQCKFWPNPFSATAMKLSPELFVEMVKHYDSSEFGYPLQKDGAYIEFWNEPQDLLGMSYNTWPKGSYGQNSMAPLRCDVCRSETLADFCDFSLNGSSQWDGPPQRFFKMMSESLKAIKAINPRYSVGGPGLASDSACPYVSGGSSMAQEQNRLWLTKFFEYLRDTGAPLDFLSWHISTDEPEKIVQCYKYYDKLLSLYGFSKAVQIVSEWSVSPNFASPHDRSPYAGKQSTYVGASILTAMWILMQTATPKIQQAYINRAADGPFVPHGPGFPVGCRDYPVHDHSFKDAYGPFGIGMLTGDGRLKPTGAAFKFWSRLSGSTFVNYRYGADYLGPYYLYTLEPTEMNKRDRGSSHLYKVLISTAGATDTVISVSELCDLIGPTVAKAGCSLRAGIAIDNDIRFPSHVDSNGREIFLRANSTYLVNLEGHGRVAQPKSASSIYLNHAENERRHRYSEAGERPQSNAFTSLDTVSSNSLSAAAGPLVSLWPQTPVPTMSYRVDPADAADWPGYGCTGELCDRGNGAHQRFRNIDELEDDAPIEFSRNTWPYSFPRRLQVQKT